MADKVLVSGTNVLINYPFLKHLHEFVFLTRIFPGKYVRFVKRVDVSFWRYEFGDFCAACAYLKANLLI